MASASARFRPDFCRRTLGKDLAVLVQRLLGFLADAAADEIGLAGGVAGYIGQDLNHLLLVDANPHRLREDRLQDLVYILRLLLAVEAGDEIRDEIHRPGPVERDRGGDVIELGGAQVHQAAPHPRTFDLEHAHHVARSEQLIDLGVVDRQVFQRVLDAVALLDQPGAFTHQGQRRQPEEVHFQQADRFEDRILVLGDGRGDAGLGRTHQRRVIGSAAGRPRPRRPDGSRNAAPRPPGARPCPAAPAPSDRFRTSVAGRTSRTHHRPSARR